MKKVNNLEELVDLVGKDTVDKCFTENMMLLIAKANRLEKVENLMDRISILYDETDGTEESDLKAMFISLTEILMEYEDLLTQAEHPAHNESWTGMNARSSLNI